MTIYHQYAPFYDSSGQMRFVVLMGHYLGELLERHPAPGRRALDLACGTGTLALMLADQGWDVVGLDTSAAMLELAGAKAAALDTPGRATFVQGDMRRLLTTDGHRPPTNDQRHVSQKELSDTRPGLNSSFVLRPSSGEAASSFALRPSSFDLATCTYDSLNYLLSEADLAACFAGVARALRPGGLFVADMNTRHFLEHDWGVCSVEEHPGFVQISQSSFDPVSGQSTMVLTGFAGDDQRGYTRFDEVHIERAYPDEQVRDLLEQSGLAVEAAYDCFTFQPVYPQSQRIAWVARRPA
jgi:SAM-dependent methyltransferase